MARGGEIIGILLGAASLVGILYALVRLYVASRISRRNRAEPICGDVIELPAAAMSGGGTAARGSSRGTEEVIARHLGTGL